MISTIKKAVWNCLKGKEVALFMIFTKEGEILYHRGREVEGRTLAEGHGFCRALCLEALQHCRVEYTEGCLVYRNGEGLGDTAEALRVRGVMVFPVSAELYFYLDSGSKEGFTERDRIELQTIGRMFSLLVAELKDRAQGADGIVGRSAATVKIRELALKYALEEDPILLLGETGVGKNHLARLLHSFSGRGGSFVSVHTPGLPRELLENQLFGHRKGSYTGASDNAEGFVAQAEGGTLFLDEIAELPLEMQARILRLIDEKRYCRIGDPAERRADIRIIAATNRDLRQAVTEKSFREDLYFRLNVLPLSIPPLRERPEDVPALIEEFAPLLRGKKLLPAAMKVLAEYSWPGNVRELRTVLKKAAIHCEGEKIGPEVAGFLEKDLLMPANGNGNDRVEQIWQELKAGKSFWEVVKPAFKQREINRSEARVIIDRAVNASGGKYVSALPLFNLKQDDYHRFMTFLADHNLGGIN